MATVKMGTKWVIRKGLTGKRYFMTKIINIKSLSLANLQNIEQKFIFLAKKKVL